MKKRIDAKIETIVPEEFRKLNSEGKIMKIAKNFDTPQGKEKGAVLAEILNKSTEKKSGKLLLMPKILRLAAASILLLAGFYATISVFSNERMVTRFAEQKEFILPDKTAVSLNADSRIDYAPRKFNKSRILKLNGEAFFDVEKGSPFLIETRNGTIEILGTQLNVFSRDNQFYVSCISGKVKVSVGNEEQIITAGELVELKAGKLLKKSGENIHKTISWKEGIFYFEEKPLISIFETLERQFDVSVTFQGNINRKITVVFSNNDIQEALDVICIPMDLEYEIQNKKIRISENPN